MTADDLARDAKRRAQRLLCLVGNVVQRTVKWARKGGCTTTFPRRERGDAAAAAVGERRRGRAVGRGRGLGRLCRCEAAAAIAAVGPGEFRGGM